MKKQVGGLMSTSEVGAAFENLLKEGQNGDVMAVWKDCPPYFIPDTRSISDTICLYYVNNS